MATKLKPIQGTNDFSATKGAKVKLVTRNHVGDVLINKLEYGGKQHIPDGTAVSEVTIAVLPDRNTIKFVFVYEASTSGRGELRESGGADSQFLRQLIGSEPFQMMRIIGE